uniref:Uncharacterized protein n=1 Tax=Salmonella phage vB_SEnST11_KE24 TaxID=3161175 RepID=A0AAU8GFX6_9CAUD
MPTNYLSVRFFYFFHRRKFFSSGSDINKEINRIIHIDASK